MSFCREHAFYQPCPGCEEQPLVWVIPIIEHDRAVGEIRLSDAGGVQIVGEEYLPIPEHDLTVRIAPDAIIPTTEPDPQTRYHLPVEVAPDKPLPAIVSLFLGVDLEAAKARGRRVYEQAVELSRREEIPLADALRTVGERLSESSTI